MKPIEKIQEDVKVIQNDIIIIKDLLKYIKKYVDDKIESDKKKWF